VTERRMASWFHQGVSPRPLGALTLKIKNCRSQKPEHSAPLFLLLSGVRGGWRLLDMHARTIIQGSRSIIMAAEPYYLMFARDFISGGCNRCMGFLF
jgi:hypothetical protein